MAEDAAAANDLLTLTAEIVTAHVSHNSVHGSDLPKLIAATYQALAGLGTPAQSPAPEPEQPKGAVSVRKSIADPTRIISMIDGKPYTSLTRHLKRHGYTKESYRTAFNLPEDYPLIASAYAARRREIAQAIGLGRKKVASAAETVEQAAAPVVVKAKRGTKQAVDAVVEAVAPKVKRARKTAAAALQSAKEHLPG